MVGYMKKNTKNTLSNQQLEGLIDLLQKGYSLDKSLELMYLIDQDDTYLYLIDRLKKGESIQNVFKLIHKDFQFNEMFVNLISIKGLTGGLIDSLHYVKQKHEWTKLLKKQLIYPCSLILVMLFFSIFVKLFLLPEMMLLYQSFDLQYNQALNFTLIYLIPNLLLLISVFVSCVIFIVVFDLKKNHIKPITYYLKLPLLKNIIQTYYSLKFAFYFSRYSAYFQSFFDTIEYFYKSCRNMDLKIVLDEIYFQLKDGSDLQSIIQNAPYFTNSFKQFFYMVILSKQNFKVLDDYCEMTFKQIQNYLKRLTNFILAIIYLCTGIYIMNLYSLMIVPVLEITSNF